MRLIERLSNLIDSHKYWQDHEDPKNRWSAIESELAWLACEHLPSGSGFDLGTTIQVDSSTPDRIVFHTSFHHMKEGFYDGWTEHTVLVKPSFVNDLRIIVGGRNRNDIKEYIGECFYDALTKVI